MDISSFFFCGGVLVLGTFLASEHKVKRTLYLWRKVVPPLSYLPLSALACGQCAIVMRLDDQNDVYQRLLTLGFTKETRVKCLFSSAFGDPRAYQIKDAVVALRACDAQQVVCEVEVQTL